MTYITDNGKYLLKVNRNRAKRMFSEGSRIYLLPCKVALGNPFINPISFQTDEFTQDERCKLDNFERYVDQYEYYNCCFELGNYPSYYAEA